MCGIFGWFAKNGSPSGGIDAAVQQAKVATNTLAHRGPDNASLWQNDNIVLGHRRLSILDLSDNANQPFHDDELRLVLCFNGEIYNYVELRAELQVLGCTFRTQSDTEVMLHAFKVWGDAALCRFDGMFAGALYDRKDRRLLLFRDHLGQKPLYVFETGDDIIFASELRAILSLKSPVFKLNRNAFARYLLHGYYALTDTPITGVEKLLPGYSKAYENGHVEANCYWTSTPGATVQNLSEDDAIDQLENILSRSCDRAMRTDVPYGVFLSGGIDSSLVLDFCRQSNQNVRAFSVSMAEKDFDESPKANLVARHLNVSEHHTFEMNTQSVVDSVEAFWKASDEPHGDPGFVNTYFLAQACRPHLTVGIAGDGGDELFAGYAPFQGLRLAPILDALPTFGVSILKSVVNALPASDKYLGLRFKGKAFLQGFPANDASRLALWLASMDPSDIARIVRCASASFFDRGQSNLSAYGPIYEIMKCVAGRTSTQQSLHYYQRVFLPEFVCMHTDRAAMQHSLEVRAPFLSPDLISFANSLPDKLKLNNGITKHLLRRLAEKRGLPQEIITQRKQGFTFPLARWLKTSLRDPMEQLLVPDQWAEDSLVDSEVVTTLKEEHLSGRENHYRILYNLMCFKRWQQEFPSIR
jgi:asparagine synthase (glutamine-hydrolysing)